MQELKENAINVGFIAIPFAAPFILVPHFFGLSNEGFGGLLAGCWLVGIVLIADWYHLHFTESYKSCFGYGLLCVLLIITSLGIENYFSQRGLFAAATFEYIPWDSGRYVFLLYLWGLASLPATFLAIFRLLVLEAVSTPEENRRRREVNL